MSTLDALRDVVELYRAAQVEPADRFAARAFGWLDARIGFDRGIMVTSMRRDPTWIDAHFDRVPDPRALMESHARVRDLDIQTERLLTEPGRAHALDYDDPAIAPERYRPFREHLERFAGMHCLAMSIVVGGADEIATVLIAVRETFGARFSAADVELLEACGPHVAEAAAVNRMRARPHDGGLPIAQLAPDGRFVQTTPEFIRLLWAKESPEAPYLPLAVLRQLRSGRPWPVPGGKHSLYGVRDDAGGWLLRLRTAGPIDRLS